MYPRSSRHTSMRKISEIVRPSLRATSLFVSPDGSLANSSNISKPFSRAGVGYRLEALGVFVFFIDCRNQPLGQGEQKNQDHRFTESSCSTALLPPPIGSLKYYRT